MSHSKETYLMARDVAEELADKEQLIYLMWEEDNRDLTILDWSLIEENLSSIDDINKDIKNCFIVQPNFFNLISTYDPYHNLGKIMISLVAAYYKDDADFLVESAKKQMEFDRRSDETQKWLGEDRI